MNRISSSEEYRQPAGGAAVEELARRIASDEPDLAELPPESSRPWRGLGRKTTFLKGIKIDIPFQDYWFFSIVDENFCDTQHRAISGNF